MFKTALNATYKIYAFIFGRIFLMKFNKFLYQLSIRGMGIMNHENEYLNGENKFLSNLLKHTQKPVIFDVGANVGKYSNKIAQLSPSSIIHAFEPHPETYKTLISNVNFEGFNGNNLGVGKENGILELFDYKDNDGSTHASLFKGVIEDIHNKKSISHKVDVIKLDDYISKNQITKIDLVKVDTEGNELNVLEGLKKTMDNGIIKTIHFEFNEMNIISNSSFKHFWDLLSNYTFYRMLPNGKLLKIKKYNPLLCEIYAYQNIIAILNK